MRIPKTKCRKINVEGNTYLWMVKVELNTEVIKAISDDEILDCNIKWGARNYPVG